MRTALCSFAFCVLILGSTENFGQQYSPEALDPEINSRYAEVYPVLTPAGCTLYFTRINHPDNGKSKGAIWRSERGENGAWTSPVVVSFLNKGKFNRVLSVSDSGRMKILVLHDQELTLYHLSDGKVIESQRLLKCTDASLDLTGKYLSCIHRNTLLIYEHIGQSWEQRFSRKLKEKDASSPFLVSAQEKIYFNARNNKLGSDIYQMVKLGVGFSEPFLLRDAVNSKANDQQLRTTGNGAVGVFSSDRDGDKNIYSMRFFDDHPSLSVHGNFLNAVSQKIIAGKNVKLGISPDEGVVVEINQDSGTYALKLPFGEVYRVEVSADYFESRELEITTKGLCEVNDKMVDLLLLPFPYVVVRGRIRLPDHQGKIPVNARVKILVNDTTDHNSKIDFTEGTFELNLDHGNIHTIQLKINEVMSEKYTVDLLEEDSFREIIQDIDVELSSFLEIRGKVLDGAKNKVLPASVPLAMKIESKEALLLMDSSTRDFRIWLTGTGPHILTVAAPGYCPYFEFVDPDRASAKDIILIPIEVGQTARFHSVSFETGKTDLNPVSYQELDRVIQLMHERPSMRLEISAHTHNASKISTLERAREVIDYFVSKGITKSRLEARGYGATKPLAPHGSVEGKLLNTRVEYTIIEK